MRKEGVKVKRECEKGGCDSEEGVRRVRVKCEKGGCEGEEGVEGRMREGEYVV